MMKYKLCRGGERIGGQGGYSLVEVVVAILLISSLLLTLAMGMFTINRTTVSNERIQMVDVALLSYGEIIRSQIDYRPCRPGYTAVPMASDYQNDTGFFITGNTGPGPGTVEAWLQPPTVVVELEFGGVDSWDIENGVFADGCLVPDTGVQLISYRVTYNPVDGDPITRTGQVVKRLPGPS